MRYRLWAAADLECDCHIIANVTVKGGSSGRTCSPISLITTGPSETAHHEPCHKSRLTEKNGPWSVTVTLTWMLLELGGKRDFIEDRVVLTVVDFWNNKLFWTDICGLKVQQKKCFSPPHYAFVFIFLCILFYNRHFIYIVCTSAIHANGLVWIEENNRLTMNYNS